MAHHEPVDPLAELDALLKQELAVTPSPEFLPRVREAVRLEPGPTRWPRLWFVAPAAAAATLVVAAGLWSLRVEHITTPARPAKPTVTVATIAPHANVLIVPSTEPRVPNPESRVPNPESRTPAAEVIVDQRQRAALLTLLRMTGDGRLTEDSFKNTTPAPAELGVAPVAVSPIVVGGVLLGESDRK